MNAGQVGELVVRLSALRAEYESQCQDAQETLREYVTSPYPIADRFEVWSEWCKKKDYGCVIDENDVPLFGKIVDADHWGEFCQYENYDWLYFLDMFDVDEGADIRKQYSVTSDDVRELLIKHNFGSFTMDW